MSLRRRVCPYPNSAARRARADDLPDADRDASSRTCDLSAGHDVYAWLLEHERD